MDPIEQRVRASLRARAEDAEPTPHLYRGVQDRISRRQRLRVLAWSLAGVAAVVAAAVVVPNLVAGLDTRTPEVLDTPDRTEEDTAAPAVPGEPTHTLLGLEDGSIVVADLDGRDRQNVWSGDGQVRSLTAAPGSTAESFRAVSVVVDQNDQASVTVLDRDRDDTSANTVAAVDLPGGGSGQPPAVALSSDGRWLAYTGISQDVDAAVAVYVVPIDPGGTLDVGAFEEVYTVTSGDPSDAIFDLVQWVGPTDVGGESHLFVRGEDGQGAITLVGAGEGFEVPQRGTFDGVSRDALDLSSAFVAADPTEDPVFLLERGEGGLPVVRFEGAEASTDRLGVDAEEVALDARGHTALLVGGGSAITVRFDGSDDGASASFSSPFEGVTASALLGGETMPPPEDEVTTPEDEPAQEDEPVGGGELGDGMVVADDRTVTLVRPDGSRQELVTFPVVGESTVVDVAVRPGSTADDLVVAITTRAEGNVEVRWLRVVDGEVDTTIDSAGSEFPAIGIRGPDGLLLDVPDLQDAAEPAAVWSPDGDLLAVVARPEEGARLEVRTIGWSDDGPSDDPNLAAMFELDTRRPLEARQWIWTEGDGAAREGQLLLVDELARDAFAVRLDRQADGAPAMPADNPLQNLNGVPAGELLDVADADGDGMHETFLVSGDPSPRVEWREFGAGSESVTGVEVDAAGPRDVSFVAASEQVLLVVLDPSQPMLVDRTTGEVSPAPIEGEVVSADLIRPAESAGVEEPGNDETTG